MVDGRAHRRQRRNALRRVGEFIGPLRALREASCSRRSNQRVVFPLAGMVPDGLPVRA